MFTLTSDSIGHLPQLVTCSSNCSTLKYTFYTMHTSFVVKTSKFGSEVVVFVGIFHEEVANKQVKAFCFSQMKKNTNLFYAANQKS